MKDKKIYTTQIYGDNAFGIWLKWWDIRIWLAGKGLFVKKISYEEAQS